MITGYTKEELAQIIRTRGAQVAHGIRGIRREMAAMDKNGTQLLERPEFVAGLRACGIEMSDLEMDEIFRHYDFNADLSVHYDEFLIGVRKPLSARRILHARKIFNTLDTNNNHVAYLADMANAYNAADTPLAQAGVPAESVLQDFLEVLDSKKTSSNGLITFAEFSEYYADVGNMMESDADFARMLQIEWGVNDSALGSTELHIVSSKKALEPRVPEALPEYVPMVRLPDHLDPSLASMAKEAFKPNSDKVTNPNLANTSGGAIYNLEAPVKRPPDMGTYHMADLRPDLLARFPERGGLEPGNRVTETKEQFNGKPFPPRVAQSTWKAEDTLSQITKEYVELATAPLMTTDPLQVAQFNYQTTMKATFVDPSRGVEVGPAFIPPPRDRQRGGYKPKMDRVFKSVADYEKEAL